MVVLDVGLEVLRQVVDAFRKDRHLHFRRTSVAGLGRISLDDVGLAVGCNRHRVSYCRRGSFTNGGRAGMSSSAVAHKSGSRRQRTGATAAQYIVQNSCLTSGIYAVS